MLEKILDYVAIVLTVLFLCSIAIFLVFLFIKTPPLFYFVGSLALLMWSFYRTGRFIDKWSEEKIKPYHKQLYRNQFKCYVAKPVDELLKQARDALNSWDEDYAPAPPYHFDLVDKIDKFLGEK